MATRYTLTNTQLNMTDLSGNTNFLSRDSGIQTMNISGKYIALNNVVGLNINGSSGTIGQMLTKDNSNNMVWKTKGIQDIIVGGNTAIDQSLNFVNASLNNKLTINNATIDIMNNSSLVLKYTHNGIQTYNSNILDITTINGMTLQGTTSKATQVIGADICGNPIWSDNWSGTATSNLNMSAYSIIGSSLDASATSLTIGGTHASSLILGKTGNTTNILGILNIAGSPGTNGQVLTSNGTTSEWMDNLGGGVSGWTGTATSSLNMSAYSIIGSSLDASATSLTIGGTHASSLILGKTGNTTNILGILNIAGSPGTNGQVLTSNGTTSEWMDNLGGGVSGWTGTATSNLNMSGYSITGSNICPENETNFVGSLLVSGVATAITITTIPTQWGFIRSPANIPGNLIPVGVYILFISCRIVASTINGTLNYLTIGAGITSAMEYGFHTIIGGLINTNNNLKPYPEILISMPIKITTPGQVVNFYASGSATTAIKIQSALSAGSRMLKIC